MKIKIELLLTSLFALSSCNGHINRERIRTDFPESQEIQTHKAFGLDGNDDIKGTLLFSNKLYIENMKKSPLYNVYDEHGKKMGAFGIEGHGKDEFLMPHLFEGTNDTIFIFDNGNKYLYSIFDTDVIYRKPMKIRHNVNRLQTIQWPFVGYYYYARNQITWNIYDLANDRIVESIPFQGDTPFLESFVWSSNGQHLVFAYKYYKKMRICKLSSKMTIINEHLLYEGSQQPQESHCFYSDVVCCKDYFIVLCQEDIKPGELSGVSKVQIYDYEGNPLKELIIDNLYINMAWNEINKQLYFISLDGNEMRYVQL